MHGDQMSSFLFENSFWKIHFFDRHHVANRVFFIWNLYMYFRLLAGTMKAARDLMDASGAETLGCFSIIGPGTTDYLKDGPNDLKCPLFSYMHF